MGFSINKEYRRLKVKQRVRKIVSGTAERPRMTVFRSNKGIYVQLIDDITGKTLVSASSRVKNVVSEKDSKTIAAVKVGKLIAERALEAGINAVVFDRNGYLYHGRIKALADAAREGGLKL